MFEDIEGLGGPVGHMGQLTPAMQSALDEMDIKFGVADKPYKPPEGPGFWSNVGQFFSQVKPEDVSKVIGGAGDVFTGQQTLEQFRQMREIEAARTRREQKAQEYQQHLAMMRGRQGSNGFAFAKRNAVWIILGVAIVGAGVWYFTQKRR